MSGRKSVMGLGLAYTSANGRTYPSLIERFLRDIDIESDGPAGCWNWLGAKNDKGYGQIRHNNKVIYTHRFSYEHFRQTTIPNGMYIDHLCRNASCANPSHLRIVTPRINMIENSRSFSAINAAKTHCPKGHPYDDVHTYYRPDGRGKFCKTCLRERDANRKRDRRKVRCEEMLGY